MRSTFVGGIGLVTMLTASAMMFSGSGEDWEHHLTVSKNGSGAYVIAGHPTNKHYRLDDGYETRLYFTNSTGDPIKVQVGDFELTATTNDCPIASTNCSELLPNIPNTETRLVTLKQNPGLEDDDFGEDYNFLFKVAPRRRLDVRRSRSGNRSKLLFLLRAHRFHSRYLAARRSLVDETEVELMPGQAREIRGRPQRVQVVVVVE